MVRWFSLGLLLWLALPAQAQPADPMDPAPAPPPGPQAEPAKGQAAPSKDQTPAEPENKPSQDSPYHKTLEAVVTALGDASPVALVRPEVVGTQRDLGDLSAALHQVLAQGQRVVIDPNQVLAKAGARFTASPAGLARVAQRCGAKAVVFVRWIQSSEGVELYPLVVAESGALLLDQSFSLDPALAEAQPEPPPSPPPPVPADPDDPDERGALDSLNEADGSEPGLASPPMAATGEQAFEARKLSLTDHPGRTGGFDVFQAGLAVGELDLARMVARADLVSRIENRVTSLNKMRNWGIGLTLGGFAAAGLSLPLFKSGDDGLVAGSVLAGVGLAAGVTGVVLWWLYGEQATRAGGSDPVEHLLTRDEAEQAVKAYNGLLRQELGLPSAPGPVGLRWHLGPTRGGLAGGLSVAF